MNLNDRALLVQLNISQWTAKKHDKKATREVAHTAGAIESAGNYHKKLLPMSDALANIHAKSSSIRQHYYENTLPWGIDGTQILPTGNYLNFMTEFRQAKSDWGVLVREFMSQYDTLVADAPRLLGSLYDPKDYPDRITVQAKFDMDLVVMPVPTADFRTSLASDELSRIQNDMEDRLKRASQVAMQDVWQRLYDKVKHMADKLDDPKAIFRDSMVENARELCEMLPRLNIADDPNLEALRQQVEASLIRNPELYRVNPTLRQDTAAEAKAILDKMSVFMGGV